MQRCIRSSSDSNLPRTSLGQGRPSSPPCNFQLPFCLQTKQSVTWLQKPPRSSPRTGLIYIPTGTEPLNTFCRINGQISPKLTGSSTFFVPSELAKTNNRISTNRSIMSPGVALGQTIIARRITRAPGYLSRVFPERELSQIVLSDSNQNVVKKIAVVGKSVANICGHSFHIARTNPRGWLPKILHLLPYKSILSHSALNCPHKNLNCDFFNESKRPSRTQR